MDRVKSCFERIRVIRGVSYGAVSRQQIKDLFEEFQLDELQQQQVIEMLEKEGNCLVGEEEIPKVRFNEERVSKNTEKADTVVKADGRHDSAERLAYREKMLQRCLQAVKDDSNLARQYQVEAILFKNAILNYNGYQNKSVFKRIVRAAMCISSYRAREIRKNGWVCGTYMSRVRDRFERLLTYLFSEDELSRIIDSFKNDIELDSSQRDLLFLILHTTPKTVVNRYHFKID